MMMVRADSVAIELDVKHWINDGLMTLFVFVVGLEIKRELVHGELNEWRRAALPVAAAVGGMVLPALIYSGFNFGGEESPGVGHSHGDRHCVCAWRAGSAQRPHPQGNCLHKGIP
jgi:Na+:H+ antiporter, NhaA family